MGTIDIKSAKVGLIGVGNMGEALLVALLKAGAERSNVSFAVRRPDRMAAIQERYGISPSSIADMAKSSQALMIIVKPQDVQGILDEIAPHISPDVLVITFLAGKKIATFEAALGNVAVARVMPNTPTLLGKGMSILSYNSHVRSDQKAFLTQFLNAAGKTVEVAEELQDATTATSGSGPAYFFAFVEAMIAGAIEMGVDSESATTLVVQTIIGAAAMLDETGESATILREKVTSPKGVTYEGLKVFSEGDLSGLVAKAMKAAADRSKEMA
jgi:pyrroline-5-carboxylate reductase